MAPGWAARDGMMSIRPAGGGLHGALVRWRWPGPRHSQPLRRSRHPWRLFARRQQDRVPQEQRSRDRDRRPVRGEYRWQRPAQDHPTGFRRRPWKLVPGRQVDPVQQQGREGVHGPSGRLRAPAGQARRRSRPLLRLRARVVARRHPDRAPLVPRQHRRAAPVHRAADRFGPAASGKHPRQRRIRGLGTAPAGQFEG